MAFKCSDCQNNESKIFETLIKNWTESDFAIMESESVNFVTVSFQNVVDIYKIDRHNEKCKALMTREVFCHDVAAAIKTCVETEEMSPSARATAKFVEFMDQVLKGCFDKHLLSSEQKQHLFQTLEGGKKWLPRLFKMDRKTEKFCRPPCFDCLLHIIERMVQEERHQDGMSLQFSEQSSQDVLDDQFCRNKSDNKQTDLSSQNIFSTEAGPSLTSDSEKVESTEMDITSDDSDDSEDYLKSISVTLEPCAVTYFAGYLARINSKCFTCKEALSMPSTKEREDELLLKHKTYPHISPKDTSRGLTSPSPSFRNIVNICLIIFEKLYDDLKLYPDVERKILDRILQDSEVAEWLNFDATNDVHRAHRFDILERLVGIKTYDKKNNI